MGLNILSAFISHYLRLENNVHIKEPKRIEVNQYLERQGFYEHFNITNKGLSSSKNTSVTLRNLYEMEGNYLTDIINWITSNSKIDSTNAYDFVQINLVEIITNVFDHSKSEIGCYISAQAYNKKHQLSLSIVDLGIGFLESLKNSYPALENSIDAIDKAIEEGTSSKKGGEIKSRGLGLNNVSGFLRNRGNLEIISYDGLWKQDNNGTVKKTTLDFSFKGVCVSMTIQEEKIININAEDEEYRVNIW